MLSASPRSAWLMQGTRRSCIPMEARRFCPVRESNYNCLRRWYCPYFMAKAGAQMDENRASVTGEPRCRGLAMAVCAGTVHLGGKGDGPTHLGGVRTESSMLVIVVARSVQACHGRPLLPSPRPSFMAAVSRF